MGQASPVILPEKIYLTGADNFYLMLAHKARKAEAGHNVLRIVFYFDNYNAVSPLIDRIKASPLIHWIHNITLVQGLFFLKPYWHYVNKGIQPVINETNCAQENIIPSELLNRDISLNQRLMEFDVLHYPSGKIAFVISWHHIIMDGRGSGYLMRHLNGNTAFDQETINDMFPKAEKRTGLIHAIKNMYEVRDFVQESSFRPITTVANQLSANGRKFNLKTIHFSETETALMDNNAKKNGARFGANLFQLAVCAQSIHQLNILQGKPGTIWLPIPYDGRKRGGNGPIVTNTISFLFYRLELKNLVGIKETIACINQQMMEQLKIELPTKYSKLLNMMRHIPLSLYSFLTTYSSKGVVSSFLYSSAGESTHDMTSLLQNEATDIVVIPPFIFPPGLTFSFLRYKGCLKMNIAYCVGSISENELNLIESTIKQLLLKKD